MATFVSTLNGFHGLGLTNQEHTGAAMAFLGAAEQALEAHAGLSAASCRQKFESIRQIHQLMVMAETHASSARTGPTWARRLEEPWTAYQKRRQEAEAKQQKYVEAFKKGCLSGMAGLGILRNGTGSAAKSHKVRNSGQGFVVEVTYHDGTRTNHVFDLDEQRDMNDFIRDLYE